MTSYTNSPQNQSVPWRSVLPIHAAAMLLPRMHCGDLKELGADIAANGQHTPIVLLLADDGTEQLLDGVNRLDAMEYAGIAVVKDGAFNHDRVLHQHIRANTDPYRFVLSVNLYRRHLTNEQKTQLIGKLLELKPAASDRMIASMTGTSHPSNFLDQVRAPAGTELILTNPPFKDATEFVDRALELCPRVIMLCRLAFLESERRYRILDTGTLAAVHVFKRRLPMMHREGWTGRRASSAMPFAWFVWDRNHVGPATVDRISWEG